MGHRERIIEIIPGGPPGEDVHEEARYFSMSFIVMCHFQKGHLNDDSFCLVVWCLRRMQPRATANTFPYAKLSIAPANFPKSIIHIYLG